MRFFSLPVLFIAMACSLSPVAWAESTGQLRAQAQSAKSDLASVQREIKTAQKKLRLTQGERNKPQSSSASTMVKVKTR